MLTEKNTDVQRAKTMNAWTNQRTFEEEEYMDTFEEHWRWFYQAECGEWHMFELIPLDTDAQECQDVVNQFSQTMPGDPIKSIQRIQNLQLWESFCLKKAQMSKTKRINIEERMLFHGTCHKNIRSICTFNFDMNLAKNNGVYGKGIYFARNASYSNIFCHPPLYHRGITPSRTMILARVLVGEYTVGHHGLCQPPSKQDNTGFYDSCVDFLLHPNIFVVFNSNQIYPEYLIEFE
ncbi:hypothetical protein JZ751_022126 [Albula glossodonta]|uniref:Poly [ADP-ribose] polymerase n=1 Tax=Albula glossodonta TaxID=121402 RepID=A0A8T2NHZ2_9TELE|nr:hypothetical protein JZ751_022126 [Albula glossodonta]